MVFRAVALFEWNVMMESNSRLANGAAPLEQLRLGGLGDLICWLNSDDWTPERPKTSDVVGGPFHVYVHNILYVIDDKLDIWCIMGGMVFESFKKYWASNGSQQPIEEHQDVCQDCAAGRYGDQTAQSSLDDCMLLGNWQLLWLLAADTYDMYSNRCLLLNTEVITYKSRSCPRLFSHVLSLLVNYTWYTIYICFNYC